MKIRNKISYFHVHDNPGQPEPSNALPGYRVNFYRSLLMAIHYFQVEF